MAEKRQNRYPPPFSLRLSDEQRAQLEKAAAGMSLGEYVRSRLFNGDVPVRRTRCKFPVKDHQTLGQLLGQLGRSRLSNNLNQLAKASNSGSLPLTPETEAALRRACAEIHQMRQDLISALGLDAGG